jgi:hypothetical protein
MIKMILLLVSAFVGLWWTGGALFDLWSYWRLDQVAWAQNASWSVIEYSPSSFALQANYQFAIQDRQWDGKTIFKTPYLNGGSAEKALQLQEQGPLQIWYNGRNPQISSAEKEFPFKKCFYALITLGVGMYFFLKLR